MICLSEPRLFSYQQNTGHLGSCCSAALIYTPILPPDASVQESSSGPADEAAVRGATSPADLNGSPSAGLLDGEGISDIDHTCTPS